MSELNRAEWSSLLMTFLIGLIWTCFVALRSTWRIITKGPSKVFHVKQRSVRPELFDDPSLGTHNFARLKTLKLHYVMKGSPEKPLMLFLHGFPEMWYSWRHQIKEFSKDFCCVAVDMRGYGESDKPVHTSDYTMKNLINDVKDLLSFLGREDCVLVSHDWGAAVAWDFAWRNPHMVIKLIICNCPNSKAMAKHMQNHPSQLLKSWYMFFFQLPWIPEFFLSLEDYGSLNDILTHTPSGAKIGTFSNDEIEAFKYTWSAPGALKSQVNYYRAAFQYKPEKYSIPKVKVPTLIVWGTNDKALEKGLAEESARYCDDCTIEYVEGASHWVQQEEPTITNDHIRKFLA